MWGVWSPWPCPRPGLGSCRCHRMCDGPTALFAPALVIFSPNLSGCSPAWDLFTPLKRGQTRLLRDKLDFQEFFPLFLLICCTLAVAQISQVLVLFLVLIRTSSGAVATVLHGHKNVGHQKCDLLFGSNVLNFNLFKILILLSCLFLLKSHHLQPVCGI